jgi:hypothetical protein
VIGTALLLLGLGAASATVAPPPRSVTLPFSMDPNRMIVDVELVRADGTIRKARAWVDTGNPDLFLGEPLARDLGLEFVPPEPATSRIPQAPAHRTPQMRLDGLPLDLAGVKTQVLVGARSMPGVPAEANLPAGARRHDHVVFDDPNRQLTVARPGTRKPRGIALPCRVNADTGLFQIEASADGRTVSLAVDNGSSYTWVSDALTTAWEARHPDGPRSRGAVGVATKGGRPAVAGIQPGDRLVRVGTRETAGATMGTVADALRGTPGSRRVLVVEREGKRVTVEAEVLRFP